MTNAIEVSDLWWRYSQETDWVLTGVNLEVQYGETVCIVGPTGAGKTTLLSCIQSLLPHSFAMGTMKGKVIVDGADTRTTKAARLAGRVGMAFEDAEAQFVFPSVEDDLAFGLENLNIGGEEASRRLKFIQEEFGIAELMGRTAAELSGGQKQRVSIAGLVAVQPRILLLDEPTSELDPVGKTEVMNLIRKIRQTLNTTIVIVEQDLEDVVPLADRFLLLDSGKILLEGKPKDFFVNPKFLLEHGVYPPEISVIFGPLRDEGLVSATPLNIAEAKALMKGG
ncbi:MAG TPA: ABC transporter ATP-binding protein [Candidatus Bathyarchaeia archaeon]|nr:ABC transporter ATP-binding protein [Candidatus Bathyarchaeia archaeon]